MKLSLSTLGVHLVAGRNFRPEEIVDGSDFNTLVIPSMRKSVGKEDFRAALQEMFDKNQCDNGIVFIRDRAEVRFG